MPTRAEAEALLEEFTQSDALRKHGCAVEEPIRAYARFHGVSDPQDLHERPLPEHVAFLIDALKPIAEEIGL